MKKTLLLFGVGILFSMTTFAQVHFGLKAGMNASELHSSDVNYSTKIGFHAGALAHIHTKNKSWGIQPEVMYSLEGAKSDPAGKSYNLHFINVPVLVQYMFDNGFRLEAGPQLNFLVAANSKEDDGGESTDIKDNFNTANFSVPVGIGYLTRSGFGFDARYNFGINNLLDSDDGPKLTGNNFQFGVFYQLTHTKK